MIKKGFTLVECLVSMVLGVFILSLLGLLYEFSHRTFKAEWQHATLQENARIAYELIAKNIRMAGHVGCQKLSPDFKVAGVPLWEIDRFNKITPEKNKEMKKESDAFTVRYMNEVTAMLVQEMENHSEMVVLGTPSFSEGDVLLVSHCLAAEIFRVKSVEKQGEYQKIRIAGELTRLFSRPSEVGKVQINTFFIGGTGRKNKNKKEIYALFLKERDKKKIEMIENVENMKVWYLKNSTNQEINGVEIEWRFSESSDKWKSVIALRN